MIVVYYLFGLLMPKKRYMCMDQKYINAVLLDSHLRWLRFLRFTTELNMMSISTMGLQVYETTRYV